MSIKDSSKKYNFIICDWKDFGIVQKSIIDSIIDRGERVVIAIKEFEISVTNDITPLQVMSMVMDEYKEYINSNVVKVMVIPNISSIAYLETNNPIFYKDNI